MDANKIIKEQIKKSKPEIDVLKDIRLISNEFCRNLDLKLKKEKIRAEVFIGGSLAKNTLVKTDDSLYDVDIFVRFDKKYSEDEISELLKKVLIKGIESFEKSLNSKLSRKVFDAISFGNKDYSKPFIKRVHGSRDYYQFRVNNIIIEIIPVIKVKNQKESFNVTDLSYFHVNYVLKKIRKNKKLSDEIIIAKAFTHSQYCYGAESYIKGFSGYSLELLIIHYGSFLKFIKEIAKSNDKEKIIIDDNKFYKKKQDVLMEMNEAKILSPIILIDPTFKERNALSGLSKETFLKFKKACSEFLKNPSDKFFKKKNIFEEINKRYLDLKIISVKTSKQSGDIAGTKSKKFMNFFIYNLKKEFIIKKSEFEYKENENTAYYYIAVDKKSDEAVKGPPITAVVNLANFKKVHPNAFIKEHFAYVHISHNLSFEEFFDNFLEKNKKIMKDMSIEGMNLVR